MKKAVIIGATSGIGKELALLLAKKGYCIGITGRRQKLLESVKSENPDAFEIMPMDITDIPALQEKLELLVRKLGGLDLLIISSGTGELNPDLNFEPEQRTINTNVSGFTYIADWAFHYFMKQHSGHLVGISSLAGLLSSEIAPAYNASKAYQINYMSGLRQKARKLKSGILVTDIRPGFVDTAMAKGEGQFWVAPTEKAAKQIYTAITKKRKVAYITKRWGWIALLLKIGRFGY
ncbi:SDR family NAD(P)-dependent oxidoreductase [Flavobacterium cerinum]|uniref:SDR family NAD(P)-dependent oxidoreductase n=1 Tax=Flavobacterium cerinum TaxID=2502784 RepID=A0ABY5IML0_9FLAO|nr:SDR family NAD(P)-dependent oxidoreductase [Flavobacterium cerinum]UUC44083.1 SDR family NAD(P)-dependent oxidoreductase [Flavobacterium cerinum]